MDVFSVSVSRGVITHESEVNYTLISTLSFGIFQAGMPVLGWLLRLEIRAIVSAFAPWIAFLLLLIIGLKMITQASCLRRMNSSSIS